MIQPTGLYLRLSSDWLVNAVSANLGDYLPAAAEQALGQPMNSLLSENAIHDIRNRMALLRGDDSVEHLLHVSLVEGGKPFDLSIYRDGRDFGIDAEPCDGHRFGDATGIVEGMLARVAAAGDVTSICNESVRQLRALTGFDCAMIYGNRSLLGHSARGGPPPSDLAATMPDSCDLAIVDSTAEPIAILGSSERGTHRSTLRLPTKAEAAILSANGARAALFVPLTRNGQAWGHVACYHSTPRHVGVERRNIVRLFTRIIALRIEIAELRGA